MTVGELRAFLDKHDVADDTLIYVERDEPAGYDTGPWMDACPGASVEINTAGNVQVQIHILFR